MKVQKLLLVSFFIVISHANNICTSQVEEEKSRLESDHAIAITTLIINNGKWEQDKINEVTTIFEDRYKERHTTENPLFLNIVTQNGRKIKTHTGATEFENYLAKVSISSGDELIHQGIYELHAGKVRARTLSK